MKPFSKIRKFMLAVLLLSLVAVPRPVSTESLNPIADKVLLSVVHITGTVGDEEYGDHQFGCSAFSIAPRKLLTAAHCVPEGYKNLRANGTLVYPIKIDTDRDLALLLWDKEIPNLVFRLDQLERYEQTLALGYGYSMAHPTVTAHYVMMLNYSPDLENIWPGNWYMNGFIGGMSGGPIVDQEGHVVGVVQRGSSNIGYGVDTYTIHDFLTN